MQLFDCTLRDGGNVLGNGFPADLTVMMLDGLIRNGIRFIEYGNASGMGAYDSDGKIAPLTDAEYLDLADPFLGKAELGMFVGVKHATEQNIALAAEKGLDFLRIGANAGDGEKAREGIGLVKKHGLTACFSLMKAYVLPPDALADEARRLEDMGLDFITIMDSAGTMTPDEVKAYVSRMVRRVSIPVGFHGHNNLGLSVANAVAAYREGAEIIDCGLMGMARSAGNLATEMAVAVFDRLGIRTADMYGLLAFINDELAPAMKEHGYSPAVSPLDLTFGYAGCHSSFTKMLDEVAREYGVDPYRLIVSVSEADRKNPSPELAREKAQELKRRCA